MRAVGLRAFHRQERHVESGLRQRRAIPRSVERDERAVLVLRRKLRARVEQQAVRRPVTREGIDRLLLALAAVVLLAIAAVLRAIDLLVLGVRVVAIWPAVVPALHDV